MRWLWLPKQRKARLAQQAKAAAQAEQLHAEALRAEGAARERERIRQIHGHPYVEGHQAIIDSMMFDGKSSVGDVALAVVAAERERLRTVDATAIAWRERCEAGPNAAMDLH